MQITVTGQHYNIGNSLFQTKVKEEVERVVTKYFDRAISAEIVFSKPSHHHENYYKADISVNEGTGLGYIKGQATADDIKLAFDNALDKIERRLSRYKGKIKNHHKPKMSVEVAFENQIKGAKKYVLSPHDDANHNENEDNPVIVAEKTTEIESLTVGEAVMKMDLRDLPALLFRNKINGRLNIVYHRVDGNISWVDPNESMVL